ncbi:7133_t:CDS:10 [Ambispora gerdemannii]|uniref:7133_t:CDS:1 n=1 Tax=Ambispora gerdemannii TaxID=144530 RepID=A0A9N8ZXY0_9GLOM|nr:7133_t:CDS:10 [Ambispora gerdemannii]
MVSKFTDKDLETLEAEAELKIYRHFQSSNPQLGLPVLNQQEEKNFRLAVFQAILAESEIDRYQLVCNNLEPFFSGRQDYAGPQEKMAYKNFQYYKELSSEAMKYFADHFARSDYFGLNYPDISPAERMSDSGVLSDHPTHEKYSPRLDALKVYLQTIYELRVKVQLLDILIRQHHTGGTNPNVSMGEHLFQKMFGSANPTAPTSQQDFNAIQNEILDQPEEPPQDQKEQKDKKRDKSPSRQAAEDKLNGKETPPPKHTEFNSSDFNDTLNALSGALDKDSKEQGHDQPFTPSPGLGMPLGSITKEEAAKLPWLAINYNIDYETSPFQGYERLVKDEEPPSTEREREQLLIGGKRQDDQRTMKFTRWMQTYDKAFDLDDTSHLIGKLKEKGLFGGFKPMGLEINDKFINSKTLANNVKTLAQLVGQLKGTLVRIGPDALELIDSQDKDQKGRSQDETPESRDKNRKEPTDQDLKDMGLTREEFDLLNTAFTDPAHIANIIKKLAASNKPEKVAEMLNRMFEHLQEKTREAMFNQMVDNNPEKDKIFEEQVNKNPRYGPPGEDTQERRDRFEEYEKADDSQKENMQNEENERFTTDNANREAGAGDESVGTETDNNFSGQFSFADSLQAINKLKNIGNFKPEGMEEGMKSNQPY